MKLSLILLLVIAGNEVLGLDVVETMFKKIGTYGKTSACKIESFNKFLL